MRSSCDCLFLYGERNGTLSYLQRLRSSGVQVVEIPSAGHFVFYDNPVATFQAVGEFVHALPASLPDSVWYREPELSGERS